MKKQEAIIFWKKFGVQQSLVEQILIKKTGLNKSQFFLNDNLNLTKKDLQDLDWIFKKVAFWYPIEYVLEKAEFYWLDFYVDNRCLIPRNDTEIMVKQAIQEINNSSHKVFYIDVWTGSWAIAISVYKNSFQNIKNIFAIDISEDALEVSKKNLKIHNLEDKIELKKSDLLSEIFNFFEKNNSKKLVITANLPYIKNNDFWNMDKEVILYEPEIALYWWKKDWFELYEKLIFQCLKLKKDFDIEKIILFIEIWFDQKEVAENFLEKNNLKYEIFKDNGRIDRCIKIII